MWVGYEAAERGCLLFAKWVSVERAADFTFPVFETELVSIDGVEPEDQEKEL